MFFSVNLEEVEIGQFVLARSVEIGVSHTCGRGVTQTYGIGVTHSCFGSGWGWSFCTIRGVCVVAVGMGCQGVGKR